MSTTETVSASALNDAAAASVASRTAAIAAAPKTAPKTAPRTRRPAPAPAPAPSGRRALTPKERWARPATATVVSYVSWLEKNVVGRKFSGPERKAAEMSLTLYGAYQGSPERRAARGA